MKKPLPKAKIRELSNRDKGRIDPEFELIFVLQDVLDPINVGSFFRTADGLNAKLILTGQTPTPPDPKISMTSRGLERSVEFEYIVDHIEALEKVKADGFETVAVDLTEESTIYSDYEFKRKTCLVVGNEARGIYKKVLEQVDAHVHLPMLGKGPSLNVNVAGSILGYEVLRGFVA